MSKLRVFSCPPVLLSSCLPAVLQSSFLLSIKKNNMKKNYNKHDRKRDPKHVPIMTKLIVKLLPQIQTILCTFVLCLPS